MQEVTGSPKRVGYVLKRYPRYSETFIVNEILAHEAAGLDIQIFSLQPPSDTHFQDIIGQVKAPVRYLPYENIKGADLWQALQEASNVLQGLLSKLELARGEDYHHVYQALLLAAAVRSTGIEHLHAHFATSATTVARLASIFSGIPYTFTAHAKDIYQQDVNQDDLQRKINEASSVITVSEYNVNYLRSRFACDSTRIKRVYNGLDLRNFPYGRHEKRKKEIVAVGRLVEKKGFDVLVHACATLAARNRQFYCRIIGTGPLELRLREQIGQMGLQAKVEMTGALPRNDLFRYVQEAAVFAAPSIVGHDDDRDGLPTTLLEAMALGTPCISTNVTGIPEVLHNEETGLMVAQRDPDALADALERLLDDPILGFSLAEKARALIESRFSIQNNSAELREIFAAATLTKIPLQRDG